MAHVVPDRALEHVRPMPCALAAATALLSGVQSLAHSHVQGPAVVQEHGGGPLASISTISAELARLGCPSPKTRRAAKMARAPAAPPPRGGKGGGEGAL